ncbi:transketolase [Candidatus Pseudothioglobus sp. Uisw_086]|uniref:transketolase n=1 Tax=Candidatus Pseudothioglobus sp. Uisw_086 TaxID=3230998 RepID=UPI003A896B76
MKKITNKIRKSIVTMHSKSYASHSGSALSIVDILAVLYFKVLNIEPSNPLYINRDKFILSKGHGSSALYSTLAHCGFFDLKVLDGYYLDGGTLPGHLDKEVVPGVEVSTGSLGHGLSIGVGMAIASKFDQTNNKIVVLCGDGEINEGSVWEAIMLAPQKKLDNLILIIDYNKLQSYGRTNEIINLEPLKEKFESFNWNAIEIDGHNFKEIEDALLQDTTKPKVIIANTIKGKGVSYMEDQFIWHYKSPNEEQLLQAYKELE